MRLRNNIIDYSVCRAVGANELALLLGVGKNSAERFGNEAGAKVKIGRRTVWNMSKIQSYLDELSTRKDDTND